MAYKQDRTIRGKMLRGSWVGRLDSVEWNGGLKWWNGLEWTGMVDWNGMVEWNGTLVLSIGGHLFIKTTF